MKKQNITTILVLSLVLSMLSACGSSESTETGKTVETTPTTSETTPAETLPHDDLPADLTLNGETVTFLYREEIAGEFMAEEINGELVNDAFFNSHLAVESRLDTDIETLLMPGHYGADRNTYMDAITTSVMAGDDQYDWVDLMVGNSPVMMGNGLFRNLLNNPYIDTDKPWYLADMKDEVAIDDRLYFISGDASLGYLKCTFCVYFNAQLADEYNVGDLYDIVNNGEWTLDKVIEISALASMDANGDGKYDMDDKLGFVLHDVNHFWGFAASCDAPFYDQDENGVWKFTFGDERDANVCEKLYQFSNESVGVRMTNMGDSGGGDEYEALSNKFIAGDILLLTAEMDDINSKLRAIEYPYGVLPYPKYSEDQTSYNSVSRNLHNAFSMPLTCGNPDAAGAVMEALSCQNYNTILPAYFETSMKVKYSLDNETAQMFDLIKESARLTFWYTYNNAVGDPLHGVFEASTKNASSAGIMASTVASKQSKLETALVDYLEKIGTLAE